MLIPFLAFPSQVIICMIILHPVKSMLRGSVFVSVWRKREDFAVYSQTCPIVLSGDGDVLKMLNALCFHEDNTVMLYFLELFPSAVKPGLVLCCIQLASHRQQRLSSTGQTKKKKVE